MGAKPALVILAAGASARLGRCKALVELGGRTPLERLLAAGAVLDDVAATVVTGADHAAIAAASPPGVRVLHNPDWSAGRTGGVLLAARALSGRDLCLAPVDVPLVPASVFQALLAEWSAAGAPALGWLAPRCGARHGHPVIAGRELLLELAGGDPAAPLRELRARANPLWSLEVPGPEVLADLDRPADLRELERRCSAEERICREPPGGP